MKRVLVLGCTGSIGTNTLDIIRNTPDEFRLSGIQAHTSADALEKYAAEFGCPALLTSSEDAVSLQDFIGITRPDIVVNGIAGAAGLRPSVTVLENGIPLALANKETIVMAGPLVMRLAAKTGAKILPVDSEHSAVFCLSEKIGPASISEIIITASGGPFRTFTKEQLESVTVEQALEHPTWKMGRKITVDSATLANKGLEVIEAANLFGLPAEKIEVAVHPQSLVHSLVRTNDGMLYAQISDPDMRHPIINALRWPENRKTYMKPFDLMDTTMSFHRPRTDDFPMLRLAFGAVRNGGKYPAAFNAANEAAVQAFLDRRIKFTAIAETVESVLSSDWTGAASDFDEVAEADRTARKMAEELLG